MNGKTELDALIGSRICHDLISPLGAIGNGVELLSMSGINGMPEIALISESIENANARIRFFRIAFGAASDTSQIGHSELQSILRDLYRGNRLKAEWRVSGDLTRREAKLAFLAILCVESALPFGGVIRVTRTGDCWHVSGTADRLKVEPELWGQIEGHSDSASVKPADVQFVLVRPTAEAMGRTAALQQRDGNVTISF